MCVLFLSRACSTLLFFFFKHTATTEIYTLSLHALFRSESPRGAQALHPRRADHRLAPRRRPDAVPRARPPRDRKSTRLNSSHRCISYAVFCLKKKTPVRTHSTPHTYDHTTTPPVSSMLP